VKYLNRFWPEILLLSAAALLLGVLMSGCNRPDAAAIENQIKNAEIAITSLKAASDSLSKEANQSNDPRIIQMAAAARSALSIAQEELPKLEMALDEAKRGGTIAFLTALWPFALPILRFIPGVGVALEPLAEAAWKAYASNRQKSADNSTQKAS
jgi:hypothetical protein